MASPTEINPLPKELDAGMMIRRALFLLVLVLLTLYYLAYDFKGLSHPIGMEQAQVGRQIARGEKYMTKCIVPVRLAQVNEHLAEEDGEGKTVKFSQVPETYHAPLNPMLNSMVLSINPDLWKWDAKGVIYTPDLLIAGMAMVLLLSSIGVTYLLVSRIFDTRIGGVTAFLMLLCQLLWRYAQSGLPQMLMLFLFSFATYFLYKAVENQQQGKPIYVWICLAAGFFALLALSHWLAVWLFLGLAVFSAFYFNPKGIQTAILVAIFGLICLFWAFHNYRNTGDILGAGRYAFYSGLAVGSESQLLRDFEQRSGVLAFDGLGRKVITIFLGQLTSLYGYLGSIVAAPLFFLSLLHPFRRKEIADFRWCILAMWVFGTIGMSLFGIKPFTSLNSTDVLVLNEATDSNNLHMLFIPLFTAYGLAFLSVLWNRLNLPMHQPIVRNGHFVLAILLSALPFMLGMPLNLVHTAQLPKQAKCHHPYYIPRSIGSLTAAMKENEVIVTDIPWATAWYADRLSLWVPKNKKQFYKLQEYGRGHGEEIAGILFTATTLRAPMDEITNTSLSDGNYTDWQEVILRYPISSRTGGIDIMQNQSEFPFKQPFPIGGNVFYTDPAHAEAYVEDLKSARE